MSYLDKSFNDGLKTLQAWSHDLSKIILDYLDSGDDFVFTVAVEKLPDNVKNELRHTIGIAHAALLALKSLVAIDHTETEAVRLMVDGLDMFVTVLGQKLLDDGQTESESS